MSLTIFNVLLPVVLLFAASSTVLSQVGSQEPTQEELDFKANDRKSLSEASRYAPGLKENPKQKSPGIEIIVDPETYLFFEGFEGSFPPAGWTTVVYNSDTWEQKSYNPFEGLSYAICRDDYYSSDEWLITSPIDLTSGNTAWSLSFAWNGSYTVAGPPDNRCHLEVWVSTDGAATFPVMLWSDEEVGPFADWVWNEESILLDAYLTDTNIVFGFRYHGRLGAQFHLDAVSINDLPPATGRCCDGDPLAPQCADGVIEADCNSLDGNWAKGLNCSDDPCPGPPANDKWQNAEIVPGPFPATVSGTTELATKDCVGVLDWNAVWYKFDVPYNKNHIDINFCGTVPELEYIGLVLFENTVNCPDYILREGYEWLWCGVGNANPKISWKYLPGPATYYFPVYTGNDSYRSKIQQPFEFMLDITEVPPPITGDFCDDPIVLNVSLADLPLKLTDQYTCGRDNFHSFTCISPYDNGEEIIYQLNLLEDLPLSIRVNPKSSSWVGVMISSDCPGNTGTCVAYDTSPDGSPMISHLNLAAGTYYIMVDTWPSPDCIPDFDLIIEEEKLNIGDNCDVPIVLDLGSSDLPFTLADQYTCGREDNYSSTCLDLYDRGEDVVFQLNLAEDLVLDISAKLQHPNNFGILVSADCPDDNGSCIAYAISSDGYYSMIAGLSLTAGIYYITVDSRTTLSCTSDFELKIEEFGPKPGDNCTTPWIVNLPAEYINRTWIDAGQTFIGRPGDMIYYELTVTKPMTVNMWLDSWWPQVPVSFNISPACPVSYYLAVSAPDFWSIPRIDTLDLPAGVYYVQIQATSSIQQFNFSISNPFLCADATGESLVDNNDLSLLRAYYFDCGTAPYLFLPNDLNCDGAVDIADVIYLDHYLNSAGPAPCCWYD